MTKPLIGRGGMMISADGKNRVLGYWPEELPVNQMGWTGKAFAGYSAVLGLIQPYHDANLAAFTAKEAKKPPPELPDARVREQRARADLAKLEKIKENQAALADEVAKQRASLKAFNLPGDLASVMNRQELRAHLRGMDDAKRREALRKFPYRQAIAEQEPELSGISPIQKEVIIEETLREFYPKELAGIDEAKKAMEITQTTIETATIALENELRQSGAQAEQAPPPKESKPWI
jgi:hypothetical protein